MFNLWNQKLTLINGMAIPYRKIVIPCCRTCNNVHIGRLDKKLDTYVRGGFKKFRKLDEQSIFQWLSRILYSILYLELITPRDPRYKRRKILRKKLFEILETVFLFLNSVRVKTTFHKPYPWSLFIFKTQKRAKPELNFDFTDNPLLMTVALRMNDIGVGLVVRVANPDRETTPFKGGFEIENAEHFHSILRDCILVPHDRDMPE